MNRIEKYFFKSEAQKKRYSDASDQAGFMVLKWFGILGLCIFFPAAIPILFMVWLAKRESGGE